MCMHVQQRCNDLQRGVRRPVQVLAHSMGCQLVSMALAQNFPDDNDFIVSDNLRRELSPNTIRVGNRLGALVENQLPAQDVRQRVSSFVFVAPDVAGPVMRRRIQTISQMGMVTVYCADDWALFISAFIRLVQYLGSGPRAGHSANLAALGLHHDTVDATGHNRNWLGHSYLYESHRMVNDVAAALPAHLPRGLISHA